MQLGLSNTDQMRLGYQIQIKCSQYQMHIKHTPNQIAIKSSEHNQIQIKYESNGVEKSNAKDQIKYESNVKII